MNNSKNNMKYHRLLIIPALVAAISAPVSLFAKENVGMSTGKGTPPSINAACIESSVQSDLSVNNVRCRIMMGDMWWDLANAQYEVPKGGGVHAIFAGSLWIGGIDIGGQLKVAGQTYRQTGNDFWPGPLNLSDASVDFDICAKYDKHFRLTRKEVEAYVAGGSATTAIKNWPGNGNSAQDQFLAPFVDANNNGIYDPPATGSLTGDYPGYDLVEGDGYGECQTVNCVPVDQLFGDETLWWVFNDKGNIHSETGGQSIGLEIRAQAFGFFTDDEINNMTFYNYRIFNRSTFRVDSCYFGVWADADLGCYTDDFVGCDVKRGLGYTYNGDNDDEVACASPGYGLNPPAIGIDFFRGPIADLSDGIDNDRNCNTDEACEQIIMSAFLYYDNTNGVPNGNPSGATHFYNYLRMKWGDGVPVTYGKNGYKTGGPQCKFMYPGVPTTDEHDWGIGGNCSTNPTLSDWDEVTAGNTPQDRRMLESAGPFTLQPGAVNVITTGVVWARANAGGAQASIKLLQVADDKAQALFDNCFKVLNGPDAPDVTVQELDKEIILYLSNTSPTSNNFNETYTEFDPLIFLTDTGGNAVNGIDTTYDFEGYKVYQLKDQTVSAADLENADKARLIAQCDVKNGISRVINFEFDQALGAAVPKEKVDGANVGIAHTFRITQDAFATGSPDLVNHKTYYFMAVAYGYNQFKEYVEDTPPADDPMTPAYNGQKKPYKQGRKNIKLYSAIPHISTGYSGGTETHGAYGSGPAITRVEGNGNGGLNLELSDGSISAILANNLAPTVTYLAGTGPVNVRVIDPLNVPDGNNFMLKFVDTDSLDLSNANWILINTTTSDTIFSDKTIQLVNEQLVLKWGISIAIEQVAEPGGNVAVNNGFIGSSQTFADPTKTWLSAVKDVDGPYNTNWIRSGTINADNFQVDYLTLDDDQIYEGVIGGTWAPYRLTFSINPSQPFNPTDYYTGPNWGKSPNATLMKDLASVNVVLTSDKSKWTRCPVLELAEDTTYAQNTAGTKRPRKLDQRQAPSVDKNGLKAGDAGYNAADGDLTSTIGMGWFPGYAINLETGERLNMAFGENSALTTIAGKGVIYYNPRAGITYTNLTGGTFSASPVGETVTDFAPNPDATAVIISDNGTNAMVVHTISGNISPGDMIVGETSGAKARVATYTSNTFQIGETVTGGTSGATGVITANMNVTSAMVLTVTSGTFSANEEITGGTSGATATVTKYSAYNFEQNGADMKWNPTTTTNGSCPWASGTSNPVFGGQHYIYVFGHNKNNDPSGSPAPNDALNIPRYDAGAAMNAILKINGGKPDDISKRGVYTDAMWANIPLLAAGHSLLETDVTIKLRVGKAYKYAYDAAYYQDGTSPAVYTYGDIDTTSQNNNLPMYTFSTEGIATHTGEEDMALEALNLIKVVPNPYYAFSYYETSNLDNRVKITNLPEECTVSIYNLGGTLIRKFKKGEVVQTHSAFNSAVTTVANSTNITSWDGSLDWDLKNTAGIPISSGVYIIHVDVPGVGEKILKWFGIMRPIDLDSF